MTEQKDFVTCAEMKAIEKAGDEAGVSYAEMMELAGTGAAKLMLSRLAEKEGEVRDLRAVVFCGKGNNGGDGFVAARVLAEAGLRVMVVLVSGQPGTDLARAAFGRLPEEVQVLALDDLGVSALMDLLDTKLVVDAMYGTGFHGEPDAAGDRALGYIDSLGRDALVVSLDLPSGLPGDLGTEEYAGREERERRQALMEKIRADFDPDSPLWKGEGMAGMSMGNWVPEEYLSDAFPEQAMAETAPAGALKPEDLDLEPLVRRAVHADLTCCFHAKKPVHLADEAEEFLGEVVVVPIGLTEE